MLCLWVHLETTAHSYRNAKRTGCPECKKLITSITHKNKIPTVKTRKLIGLKASQRVGTLLNVTGKNHPAWKGGYGRSFSTPSTQEYIWKKDVLKVYNYKCALTGSTRNLVCHHLNGWNAYPNQRFDVTNGVVVTREVHSKFHIAYKFGNNTQAQFQNFCGLQYTIDWFSLKKIYLNFNEKTIWQYGNHQPSSPKSITCRGEGSETRRWETQSITLPRAPNNLGDKVDEIVRHSVETRRVVDKKPLYNRWIVFQAEHKAMLCS